MSEGETPTPSPPVEHASHTVDMSLYHMSLTEVQSLVNECNHLHLENAHLRDLVCWLRMQLEGMQPLYTPEPTHTQLTIFENHADFFARKEMEDAWDIVIQQSANDEYGESNDE